MNDEDYFDEDDEWDDINEREELTKKSVNMKNNLKEIWQEPLIQKFPWDKEKNSGYL